MKRATYTSRLLQSSRQRVCFDKDNGIEFFQRDAAPENHFYLGCHNYAVVSDFACVVRIHLRRCHWISPTYQRWNHCSTLCIVSPRRAYNSEQAATSASVFMIQSLLSPLKEVVHITPVKKIDGEKLFAFVKKNYRRTWWYRIQSYRYSF
ncbi:hypothetical protein TNCV_1272951 [Trichonephila clavipes]|nr:hypothetical protein TNCV_1272951 [Trichonephila clavipes]